MLSINAPSDAPHLGPALRKKTRHYEWGGQAPTGRVPHCATESASHHLESKHFYFLSSQHLAASKVYQDLMYGNALDTSHR